MIPKLDYYKERFHISSDSEIKPGLTAIQEALELVGHPEKNLPVIHLAGTNGKGSTLTMIERIAQSHDLKTASFMSPCMKDVHDQIKLNGEPIAPDELAAIFSIMRDADLDGKCTDFELLTVAAFLAFQRFQADIVLIECGMGGRYDSTNVVMPIVSVVPSIALEHTNFLGNTLASIAGHKAGIIKQGRPIITGNLPEDAMAVFIEEAKHCEALLFVYGKDFSVEGEEKSETYIAPNFRINNLDRSMPGMHQRSNMALAITAFLQVAQHLHIQVHPEAIQNGISHAELAGRFEKISSKLYIDGAHNPASARTLVDTVKEQFRGQKIHFIVGMLRDKDVKGVLRILEEVGTGFTFVDVDNERAMPVENLYNLSNSHVKEVSKKNIRHIIEEKNDEIVIITGSLYLLASWREELLNG